jgi:hypothetical protein
VLQREVYTAERMIQERARTAAVLTQLAAELDKPSAGGNPRTVAPRGRAATGSETMMRYLNNRATHRQTTDPLGMFTALPAATVKGETDSDGKCNLLVPAQGRWIVGICFQRPGTDVLSLNFGITQSYCWIEEVPAQGGQLSCTADNMLKPSVAPLGLEQSVPWR